MIGLIKKDLLMIKSNLKILIILLVVYGFMAYQGEMSLSFVLPFMSVIIMVSTFSYDAYNKWDAYVCSLPDGRKNSVKAKYLATLLLVMITTILITIFSVVISYNQTQEIDFENIFSTILGAVFATTLMQSFMYPSIYKFGVEKARIGTFVVVFGIAIIGGIIAKLINFANIGSIIAKFINFKPLLQSLDKIGNYWAIIIPLIMIGMLYLSYKISESIYKKKEY